ncbi:ATP synthase F1 subunit gamma, partial [candidate division KSB1 bacterium]
MPSLKEVRLRISSVDSTKQITSAMKMVSASKLRRAQNAILKLRPYAHKIQEILQDLSASVENSDEDGFYNERPAENILLVAVSSNRGLCGGFNSNVIRSVNKQIHEHYQNQEKKGKVHLMTIGKKSSEYFTKRKFHIISKHDEIFDELTFENTSQIAEKLMTLFLEKEYDKIEIIYNRFKNAAVQHVTIEQYLPVLPLANEKEKNIAVDYIFEPDKETIVKELIPKSLKIQLFKVFLDSFASEHGARMTTMHKATDNATEILRDLKLSYNKARQASITKEILE